jgi:hypothetical protein
MIFRTRMAVTATALACAPGAAALTAAPPASALAAWQGGFEAAFAGTSGILQDLLRRISPS